MTAQARASALLSRILDAVEALGCEVKPCDKYSVRVDGERVPIRAYAPDGGGAFLYTPAIGLSERYGRRSSFSFDEDAGDDLTALDVPDLAQAIKAYAAREQSRRP